VTPERKAIGFWLVVGVVGFLCVPWYALQGSVLSMAWLRDFGNKDFAPALVQALRHGRSWLMPIGVMLIAGFALLAPRLDRSLRAYALLALGGIGFAYVLTQGFAIGPRGWSFDSLASVWGPLAAGQFGMGLERH
jgi:iron(III) transport system permease protein